MRSTVVVTDPQRQEQHPESLSLDELNLITAADIELAVATVMEPLNINLDISR
jgi:hypothetical protein